MFLMWLGEQMTERGVGNGISLLIFSSIASGIPPAVSRTFAQVRDGEMSSALLLLIVLLIAGITAFVVYVERAQRRITVNYAKRQRGAKQYAAQQSHLPLKINMAGVIPPIFASAILMVPATLGSWFGRSPSMQWLADLSMALSPNQPLYLIFFSIAIVFFCFFYASLVFSPKDTADRLKRDGAEFVLVRKPLNILMM
jgi:preprotein translocase subunit SecY